MNNHFRKFDYSKHALKINRQTGQNTSKIKGFEKIVDNVESVNYIKT